MAGIGTSGSGNTYYSFKNGMGETVYGTSPYSADSSYKVTGTSNDGKVLYTNDDSKAKALENLLAMSRAANGGASSSAGAGGLGAGGGAGGGSGSSAYGDAITTAKDSLGNINSIVANANAAASNARGYLGSAVSAADSLSPQIGLINQTAASLSPFSEYLFGVGSGVVNTGAGMGATGNAIMAGDASVGGPVGDLISQVSAIDPDKYVSAAAQDVQSSFDSQWQSLVRGLSRTGASVSSGNSQALKQQYAQALATAKAAAMTRARQVGLSEKLDATRGLVDLGKSFTESSASMRSQGASIVDAAGKVVQSQAGIYGTAGNLISTQSGLYSTIGGVETNLGNLELSSASAVQGAVNSVLSAQQALGDYYKSIETAEIGANSTSVTTEADGLLENLFPDLYGKTTTTVKASK